MRTIAILPVKSFRSAKQRLVDVLGGGARQALAQAMFSDVLSSLRRVPALEEVAVVTADRTAESVALRHRVRVLRDPEEAGQSQAARVGREYATSGGFERMLLVPGDTPLLDPGELGRLLGAAAARGLAAAIVPDRHGAGTNALVLRPPDAIEPSFGPGSLERHAAAARAAGLAHAVEELESLALDVDTAEDLAALASRLERLRGKAPMTRGVLRQLDRARAASPRGRPEPLEASA